MRKLNRYVWIENEYVGVHLGLINVGGEILLVDAPLLVDEARTWLGEISEKGNPQYLVFLDSHPDRILGAVNYDLPIVAHASTLEEMSGWSDTFKGGTHPIGSAADQVKRIVGLQKIVPDLAFNDVMTVYVKDVEVVFVHRPGPRDGSIWILVPSLKTAFIGDFVTVSEPPYFGAADLENWLLGLDELRASPLNGYKLISSRDGLVDRENVTDMARFLRKIPPRMAKLSGEDKDEDIADKLSSSLMKSYTIPSVYQEIVRTRIRTSFLDLQDRSITTD